MPADEGEEGLAGNGTGRGVVLGNLRLGVGVAGRVVMGIAAFGLCPKERSIYTKPQSETQQETRRAMLQQNCSPLKLKQYTLSFSILPNCAIPFSQTSVQAISFIWKLGCFQFLVAVDPSLSLCNERRSGSSPIFLQVRLTIKHDFRFLVLSFIWPVQRVQSN